MTAPTPEALRAARQTRNAELRAAGLRGTYAVRMTNMLARAERAEAALLEISHSHGAEADRRYRAEAALAQRDTEVARLREACSLARHALAHQAGHERVPVFVSSETALTVIDAALAAPGGEQRSDAGERSVSEAPSERAKWDDIDLHDKCAAEGLTAYLNDRPIADCPYRPGGAEHCAWMSGYEG